MTKGGIKLTKLAIILTEFCIMKIVNKNKRNKQRKGEVRAAVNFSFKTGEAY